MCTIQFQGICYFRKDKKTSPSKIDIYLPIGDQHGDHLDGTPAMTHHARVFVQSLPGVLASGEFEPCSWSQVIDGKQRDVAGLYFPLSRGGGGGGYQIHATNVKDSLKASGLKNLLSFAAFTKGGFDIEPTTVAGWVQATRGVFTVEAAKPKNNTKWKISKSLKLAGKSSGKASKPALNDHEFSELVWNVKWDLGSEEDTDIVVSLHGREKGRVTIPKGVNPTIIVGNLDDSNPAKWPLRRDLKFDRCEDDQGKPGSGGDCYDNDCKWYYRLLRGSDGGLNPGQPLPVPRATRQAWVSLNTPTCFLGGD